MSSKYPERGDTLTAKKSMVLRAVRGRGDDVKIKKGQMLMVGYVHYYSTGLIVAFSKNGDVEIPMSNIRHFQIDCELGTKKSTAEEVFNEWM